MKKTRILLVDDEQDALGLLESLLKGKDFVSVVGKASNKSEALAMLIEKHPDVIFQDIQMHDTNGLDLVDEYRKMHFEGKIVFITAYVEYAIEAIKKAAFDYLLKPVDPDELESLMLRLLAEQNDNGNQHEVNPSRKLKIPTRQGYSFVSIGDIIYCEADGNYTYIFTSTKENITSSVNLGKFEEELHEPHFFRINRSVLINTNYLASINKGEKICQIKKDGEQFEFYISSKRIKMLESVL